MLMFYDFDDLRTLSQIVDDILGYKNQEYEDLLETIIFDYPDSQDAMVELFGYIYFALPEEIEQSINIFLNKPFEEMQPYTVNPKTSPKRASCPCPSPEEGPYVWQVALARWRTQLQR